MKNIKHIWTVLCRSSVVDNETNNISLQDILERLQINVSLNDKNVNNIPEGIIVPFNFEIVTMWAREDFSNKKEIKVDAKIEILDPSGKKLGEMLNNFVMLPEYRRMRNRGKSGNIKLTSSGKYVFRVSAKEENEDKFIEVAEIPLEVDLISNKTPQKINMN